MSLHQHYFPEESGPEVRRDRRLSWGILIGFALIAITLVCGYASNRARGKSRSDSLYIAGQLLALKANHDEIREGDSPRARALLEVGRFAGAVAFFLPTLLIALHTLSLAYARVGSRQLRDHVVICGLGRFGLAVAFGYTKAGHKVLVVESDLDNPHVAAAERMGAYILYGDVTDRGILEEARVRHASRVFINTSHDHHDIAAIQQIVDLVDEGTAGTATRPRKLCVTAVLCDSKAVNDITGVILRKAEIPISLTLIDQRSLLARHIVALPAFIERYRKDERPHFVVVGDHGVECLEALCGLVESDARADRSPATVTVTVVAAGAAGRVARIREDLPYVDDFLDIRPFDATDDLMGGYEVSALKRVIDAGDVTAVIINELEEAVCFRLACEVTSLVDDLNHSCKVFAPLSRQVARFFDAERPEGTLVGIDPIELLSSQNLEQRIDVVTALSDDLRADSAACGLALPPRSITESIRRLALRGLGFLAAAHHNDPLTATFWRESAEQMVRDLEHIGLRVRPRKLSSRHVVLTVPAHLVTELANRVFERARLRKPVHARLVAQKPARALIMRYPAILHKHGFEVVRAQPNR